MPRTSPAQLLVFAHTPPPVHGQSLMVQTLVEGLPAAAPDIPVHHVNPRLSADAADVGRWRPGKLRPLLRACAEARRIRRAHGPMIFYYVPAPGKRPALWRDLLVMLLCRHAFDRLVLHWHAVGLGAWLARDATAIERWLARRLLGRADLSIILAPELAADAEALAPKQIAVVPNGIVDPLAEAKATNQKAGVSGSEFGERRSEFGDQSSKIENRSSKSGDRRAESEDRGSEFGDRSSEFDVRSSMFDVRSSNHDVRGSNSDVRRSKPDVRGAPFTRVLFVGLLSREKGLFDLLTAIALANQRVAGGFRLTVAGSFASTREEQAFRAGAKALGPGVVHHGGFADAERKHALLCDADVFCLPTFYPHEGQPLALLEALAHDLPIVATRWRAIPSMLPSDHVWLVEPHRPDQLAEALLTARAAPAPAGALRAHFLAHFTRERHLSALAEALRSIQ